MNWKTRGFAPDSFHQEAALYVPVVPVPPLIETRKHMLLGFLRRLQVISQSSQNDCFPLWCRKASIHRSKARHELPGIILSQVIARTADGSLTRYKDLDLALSQPPTLDHQAEVEWRIHFHVPLHSRPTPLLGTTSDHILGVMDILKANPGLCTHIELETYTWEVLPPELKNRDVVDQLVAEYQWTLARLAERGIVAV